jgi:hypothetical protein
MRMTDLRLIPVEQSFWPEFEGLLRDSLADGRRTLLRLAEEWRSGVNRFARPGETLIAAWANDRLVTYERFGFERSPGLPVTHVMALAGRP